MLCRVGKTRLSIELAKALGGEIINADSVQVYQGLDIGAAKATLEERQGVPHHLMDMIPPTEDYPYERFVTDARAATEDILSRGLVPIVIGGTGMYMRHFMHNRPGITSHPFDGEDLTGEFDDVAQWDYDFQAYFLYKHRADLFPRLDLRCEQQVVELLVETSAILDMGVKPHSNNAANAIGYEEAIDLLLEARSASGVVTEQRFMEFLLLFQHNCRVLAKKQTAWYRKTSRSDVRQFRWIQAGQPVQQMVDMLAREYQMPIGEESEVQPGSKDLMAASFKEQKRMQSYKPTLQIYSSAEAVASILRWIKSTQESK
jgi:tRNA A37 N6-isopentenylltransferase MiaA